MNIFRQGDMIFFKQQGSLKATKTVTGKLLTVGLGESTGHEHRVNALEDAQIITAIDNTSFDTETVTQEDLAQMDKLFFEVTGGNAVVCHEEHDPITLEPGLYLRLNQVEYNPYTDELEKVRD